MTIAIDTEKASDNIRNPFKIKHSTNWNIYRTEFADDKTDL